MRELAAIQRAFYALVTAGEGVVPPGLGVTAHGLDVYASMYAARLHDVLADDYPKLRTALGPAVFADVVGRYLRARPPRSFTLRDAGAALGAYLATRADVPPWAADLAALERARIEVFDAADAAALTRDVLAQVAVEAFPALPLALVPASVVVPLRWSVDELWSAIEDDDATAPPVESARTVVVWRRDLRVLHRTADADEAHVLALVAGGTTTAQLAARLAEVAPSPEHRMVELLLRWTEAALLATSA